MTVAQNPILSGFYPDPSICAVGEDFYLVNSTFAYFPGIPIFHSRDLAHWEQIGNACNRISQLPLNDCEHSQGLFAPTIRYYGGTYYIICTNVFHGDNFVLTAAEPQGPWSEPFHIRCADGIDPSLFFDADGTCYYIGTHPNTNGCGYDGDWYIWIQELDLEKMQLVGEPKDVWNGSQKDVIWPEGPHLYYKDGYYYIVHAEGGTGANHAVAVCRSKNIWGPYENNPRNPILTHRHLGKNYPVKYVGHADMVETTSGEWYMVMLAVRPTDGYTTMGRETFLAKIIWEDGWPVVNPGIGTLTDRVEIQLPEWNISSDERAHWNVSGRKNALPGSDREYCFDRMRELGDEFLFLRNPVNEMYHLAAGEGLLLRLGQESLRQKSSPSYICIRQQHHNFLVTAGLSVKALSTLNRRAGLALVQSNEYQLRVEALKESIEVILCEEGEDKLMGRTPLRKDLLFKGSELKLFLQVEALKVSAGVLREDRFSIVEDLDISSLSTEVAGGFVGCTVGIYAVMSENVPENGIGTFCNEEDRDDYVCFRSLSYKELQEAPLM